jgi:hypothetical protein
MTAPGESSYPDDIEVPAAKQFNITPARRNKIVVTRTQASEKHN